jgi:hypothetical protein
MISRRKEVARYQQGRQSVHYVKEWPDMKVCIYLIGRRIEISVDHGWVHLPGLLVPSSTQLKPFLELIALPKFILKVEA